MMTQVNTHVSEVVVEKITRRQSLDEIEKAHLAACQECMYEVIRSLDDLRSKNGFAAGAQSDLAQAQPAAMKALEKGYRTFEREFGISLSRK